MPAGSNARVPLVVSLALHALVACWVIGVCPTPRLPAGLAPRAVLSVDVVILRSAPPRTLRPSPATRGQRRRASPVRATRAFGPEPGLHHPIHRGPTIRIAALPPAPRPRDEPRAAPPTSAPSDLFDTAILGRVAAGGLATAGAQTDDAGSTIGRLFAADAAGARVAADAVAPYYLEVAHAASASFLPAPSDLALLPAASVAQDYLDPAFTHPRVGPPTRFDDGAPAGALGDRGGIAPDFAEKMMAADAQWLYLQNLPHGVTRAVIGVVVLFTPAGRIAGMRLSRSSGIADLDALALAALSRGLDAAGHPPARGGAGTETRWRCVLTSDGRVHDVSLVGLRPLALPDGHVIR